MDNPRFAFFYEEKMFWRIVTYLSLLALLLTLGMLFLFSQPIVFSTWYSQERSISTQLEPDYARQNSIDLPPLKTRLLEEVIPGQQ